MPYNFWYHLRLFSIEPHLKPRLREKDTHHPCDVFKSYCLAPFFTPADLWDRCEARLLHLYPELTHHSDKFYFLFPDISLALRCEPKPFYVIFHLMGFFGRVLNFLGFSSEKKQFSISDKTSEKWFSYSDFFCHKWFVCPLFCGVVWFDIIYMIFRFHVSTYLCLVQASVILNEERSTSEGGGCKVERKVGSFGSSDEEGVSPSAGSTSPFAHTSQLKTVIFLLSQDHPGLQVCNFVFLS